MVTFQLVVRFVILCCLFLLAAPACSDYAYANDSEDTAAESPANSVTAIEFVSEGEDAVESLQDDSQEDAGIPGAIVALIFGVFGLLVVARRNVR